MISSLLSLLSSLFPLPSALVLRPSDLDRACLSLLAQGLSQTLSVSQVLLFKTRTFYLLSSLFSLLASLCALLSSLFSLLPSLFSHPSLLSSLFSLLSLLSSLFSRCCSFLRSHFAPVTSNFASGHRIRFPSTRPLASPSLARRNARSDPPPPRRRVGRGGKQWSKQDLFKFASV